MKFILTILAMARHPTTARCELSHDSFICAAGAAPMTDTRSIIPPPTSTPVPPTATRHLQQPRGSLCGMDSYSIGYGFNSDSPVLRANAVNDLVHFTLPIVPNTSRGKFLSRKWSGRGACNSGTNAPTSETVTINGISFFKEIAQKARQEARWVAYSAFARHHQLRHDDVRSALAQRRVRSAASVR
jgi:hypothetical protein